MMDGLQIQWALDPASMDMPARVRAFLDRQLRELDDGRGAAGGVGLRRPARRAVPAQAEAYAGVCRQVRTGRAPRNA